MPILTPEQTEALLTEAGAVQTSPRLPMGLIVWKDEQGRPVASARCEAILRCTPDALLWCAGDPELSDRDIPSVAIPHGLPPRQPALPIAAARGMALLAVAQGDAEFIVRVEHGGEPLFLAVYNFAQGPALAARTPTEEVPKSMAAAIMDSLATKEEPEPETEPVPESDAGAGSYFAPSTSEADEKRSEALEPEPVPDPTPVVDVRMVVGPKQQIISVTFEVVDGWMDTGLDPVQLATRPLLLGFDSRLEWEVDGLPSEEPVPHLAFRHVQLDEPGARPPFRYAPTPKDPPVPESGQIIPLGPGSRLRFPATPGRLEVKVLHLDCDSPVKGYQGYLRIAAMMQRAGPRDIPHKHSIEHIQQSPYDPGYDTPECLPDPQFAPMVTVSDD